MRAGENEKSDHPNDNQEEFTDEELKALAGALSLLHKRIVAVYEEHNGPPDPQPPIQCPRCDGLTAQYACLWDRKKQIRFSCQRCGFAVIE